MLQGTGDPPGATGGATGEATVGASGGAIGGSAAPVTHGELSDGFPSVDLPSSGPSSSNTFGVYPFEVG